MSKLLAKDVTVEAGALTFAGLTDCSLNASTTFAQSRVKSDKVTQNKPERVTWEISISGEFGRETVNAQVPSDHAGVAALLTIGSITKVTFKVGALASYTGDALVTAYNVDEPVNGTITYSATFKGVGKLSKV